MATKKNTAVKHGDKEYNYYRITRTVGHERKDGKSVPIKKSFYGTSKGNAEQKFKEWQEEQIRKKYDKALRDDAESMVTFGERAEHFTANVLPTLNYATGTKSQYAQRYESYVKHSHLSGIPMPQVTAKMVQEFYNGLDVSAQTLASVSKWMAAFYKWAQLNDYASNVLSAVTLPDKPENKKADTIIVWEPDEIRAVFGAIDGFRYGLMVYLMYYAGLRISEALGLKYSDIRGGAIYIDRQYNRGEIAPPKNKSYRVIPLHQETAAALAAHKEAHLLDMIQGGYETEYIFTTSTGKLLDYHNVRTSFERFYKRNGIEGKKLHAYRATFCTELCRAGVPIEVASKLMGHKSIEVTARHYALVKQDVQEDAISKLPPASIAPLTDSGSC